MDNKVLDLLKINGIDLNSLLDTSNEVALLESIKEMNERNKTENDKSTGRFEQNILEVEKILEESDSFKDIVDIKKLSDKDYVLQLILSIAQELKTDKDNFRLLADKALKELGGR